MELRPLLRLIAITASEVKASTPYLIGGIVRDIMLKRFDSVNDVDITCGDHTSDMLGQALVKKIPTAVYTKFSDGHGCLMFDEVKVDFSNNFNVNGIDEHLKQFGIVRPTFMEKELYSRDFTINTLLMPMDLSKVYDITTRGVKDIRSKTIDTCLDPDVTFTSDPRRIVRVVYLGAKLGFKPSKRVIEWIRGNTNMVSKIDKKYLTDKLNKGIDKDATATFELLDLLGLKQFAPNTESYNNFLANNPEMLYRALNG